MKVGILGTATVGRTLAARLGQLGHDVMNGTRDPKATQARSDADMYGNPPFRIWSEDHPDIGLGSFAEAAAHGDIVINATAGGAYLEVVRLAGEGNLEGKVLLDVANPLDTSQGMPPPLLMSNTDSLAEQIQRLLPGARVVKSLNTVNAAVMVDPGRVGGGDHSVFLSGNDADAKATVADLLRSFGWTDIIDLGDITTARGPEMLLAVWLRLLGVLRTPMYNFKVVR